MLRWQRFGVLHLFALGLCLCRFADGLPASCQVAEPPEEAPHGQHS